MKGRTDKWLKKQYLTYNRDYFHNALPFDLVVAFKDPGVDNWAVTCFIDGVAREIHISTTLKKTPNLVCIFLLHEMAHVAIGKKERAYHGALFRKERERLVLAGAFTPLL